MLGLALVVHGKPMLPPIASGCVFVLCLEVPGCAGLVFLKEYLQDFAWLDSPPSGSRTRFLLQDDVVLVVVRVSQGLRREP